MYTEIQRHPTTWLRALRAFCFEPGHCANGCFHRRRDGHPWLPFGQATHFFILLITGVLSVFLWWSGLTLRVNADGLALRFWPWQWRFRHIRWSEVRPLRLLPAGERLPGARFGWPTRDFAHIYVLASPHLRVLCIELVDQTQLFVSTERQAELLDFLQHGVVVGRRYVPEMWVE